MALRILVLGSVNRWRTLHEGPSELAPITVVGYLVQESHFGGESLIGLAWVLCLYFAGSDKNFKRNGSTNATRNVGMEVPKNEVGWHYQIVGGWWMLGRRKQHVSILEGQLYRKCLDWSKLGGQKPLWCEQNKHSALNSEAVKNPLPTF